nr:DUF397 domain-containing protein [Actinomadura sp. WMMA1423]
MIEWRKSQRSEAQGDACVELAALPGGVGVRDSKDPDAGHITLPREAFRRLLEQCR